MSVAVRIPHGAPVRCVAETADAIDGGVRVIARVPSSSPGADGDVVRPGWLIEVAAQACAACAGAGGGDGLRGGVLVGAKDWRWHAAVPVDHDLEVKVVRGAGLGDLAEYRCAIRRDGHVVADGVLLVMGR